MAMTNWPLRSVAASPKRMAGKLPVRGVGSCAGRCGELAGSMARTARPLRGSAARIVGRVAFAVDRGDRVLVAFADGEVLGQHEAGRSMITPAPTTAALASARSMLTQFAEDVVEPLLDQRRLLPRGRARWRRRSARRGR